MENYHQLDENDTSSLVSDMDSIATVLERAHKQHVEVEVVTWALRYMKNDPTLTISEAITMGYYEWVR